MFDAYEQEYKDKSYSLFTDIWIRFDSIRIDDEDE